MKKIILGILIILLLISGAYLFLKNRTSSSLDMKNTSSLGEALGISFQGHVSRGGEPYQKNIGNGLIFQLMPDSYGWNISIIPDDGKPDYDFTLATPPFHGINATQIEGWHFRNMYNTAPNDGSVSAPQETRDFLFVLNNKNANVLGDAIQRLTSGKTLDFSPNVPLGKGTLVIQNLKLGNLMAKKQAWIESMDFKVDISFSDGTY